MSLQRDGLPGFPELAMISAAVRELEALRMTLGQLDDTLACLLAASVLRIIERFGDDDWQARATDDDHRLEY